MWSTRISFEINQSISKKLLNFNLITRRRRREMGSWCQSSRNQFCKCYKWDFLRFHLKDKFEVDFNMIQYYRNSIDLQPQGYYTFVRL